MHVVALVGGANRGSSPLQNATRSRNILRRPLFVINVMHGGTINSEMTVLLISTFVNDVIGGS